MRPDASFEKSYKQLNAEQKLAVDTVEGPVMVIAGPGTGKTHILTLRIANILKETQANPGNILALTFTDSAARTMKRRLAEIIGEESARGVAIDTFHGFAGRVLERFPDHFGGYGTRRLMGDVEQVLLMREAIETADIEEIRPPKAPYTYLDELRTLYDTLTREAVPLDTYLAWGTEERARIQSDPSLAYKRGTNTGELTKAGQERLARIGKVDEAVRALIRYEELKTEKGKYDFSDVLRVVIGRIGEDATLRAELQEQYQYVLADEHQDANALQHKLLSLFAIDDFPNIFIVGDEKQAIYRFQGAEAGGFGDFLAQFPRTKVITLVSSFRSYQDVLDRAHAVIEPTGPHTRLIATRGEAGERVSLIVGADPLEERSKVCRKIAELIESGVPPHHIAVISRKNEIANLVAAELAGIGVPVLRAGDISLSSRPLIRAFLALMTYAADPLRTDALREALLAPWWEPPFIERLQLLRTTSDSELPRTLAKRYPEVGAIFEEGIRRGASHTPLECFSALMTLSGARDYFLAHADALEDLPLMRHLSMHLEEAASLEPEASFAEGMARLIRAREHDLSPLKAAETEREGSVTVITAHKAKGMEFAQVFIPDATEQGWERGGKSAMIPSPFENKQDEGDSRRLLYVALTRAKDRAYLSYARETKDGKERSLSALLPPGLSEEKVEASPLPTLHRTIAVSDLVRQLARDYLVNDGLAPTALNQYLHSPAEFFASRVLRIKEPPNGPTILGSAVHTAVAAFLEGKGEAAAYAALARAFATSLLPRDAVFSVLEREAREIFAAYLLRPLPTGTPRLIEESFDTIREVAGVLVRMKGNIDAVFDTPEGACIVDFKTGSSVSAKNQEYVRQLMYYVHLLEKNGEVPTRASLVALTASAVKELPVPVTEESKREMLAEFDAVATELLSGKWRAGEPSQYDALLRLFNA